MRGRARHRVRVASSRSVGISLQGQEKIHCGMVLALGYIVGNTGGHQAWFVMAVGHFQDIVGAQLPFGAAKRD